MDGGVARVWKKKKKIYLRAFVFVLLIHASRSEFIGGFKGKMPYLFGWKFGVWQFGIRAMECSGDVNEFRITQEVSGLCSSVEKYERLR
jgi:hypothetical protein